MLVCRDLQGTKSSIIDTVAAFSQIKKYQKKNFDQLKILRNLNNLKPADANASAAFPLLLNSTNAMQDMVK